MPDGERFRVSVLCKKISLDTTGIRRVAGVFWPQCVSRRVL